MFPATTKGVDRFIPESAKTKETPTVYLIGVPTGTGKAAYTRACAVAGLRYWTQVEMVAAARAAVTEASPPNVGELLDTLSEIERSHTSDEEASPAAREMWSDLVLHLQSSDPRFARRLGDNVYFEKMAPMIAAAVFLRGWQHVVDEAGAPLIFRARNGQVDLDLIDQLPPIEVSEIAARIYRLMRPTPAQAKNSDSPSPLPADQGSSAAAGEQSTAAAGDSSVASTNGTPA